MIELGVSNENEVVLAFLQAEIDSPRYIQLITDPLSRAGLSRNEIIDNADLTNTQHNQIRAALLGRYRGYGANNYLFQGFPKKVAWRKVSIAPIEFPFLMYVNYSPWVELSSGSRLVVDGAKQIALRTGTEPKYPIPAIRAILATLLNSGRRYPPLVAVEGHEGKLILIEGNTRSTAYVISGLEKSIEMIVGFSPEIPSWVFY